MAFTNILDVALTVIEAPVRFARRRDVADMDLDAKLCAHVSNASYADHDDPRSPHRSIDFTWKGERLVLNLDENLSSEFFCVYVGDSKVVIGFKGTSNGWDAMSNITIVVVGTIFENLQSFVEAVARMFPNHSILVTGHSLGGAIALASVIQWIDYPRVEAVHVFNSAPSSAAHITATFRTPPFPIYHHHILGDLVSCWTGKFFGLHLIHSALKTITYAARFYDVHTIENFTAR